MPNKSPILNEQVMEGRKTERVNTIPVSTFPERVLQFGEGNFLRGFIDWMIFKMNKAGQFNGQVVALQPTPRGKVVPKLNNQDGLYTLVLRGYEQGITVETIEVIDSISRGISPYTDWDEVLKTAESPDIEFVFSNTTEAGIQYSEEKYEEAQSPLSFPGKLVALLYHRYTFFNGDTSKGWIIIPCELIEKNGEVLKDICRKTAAYWKLPESFWTWVEESSVFCNTLVDRIVTGYPHEEGQDFESRLGYKDELLTVAEPYHLFVIEGPDNLEEKLPFKKAGLNVHFGDITSYRELKIKFLNAPHTILSAVGILSGLDTVKEGLEHQVMHSFLKNTLTAEISETLRAEEKEKAAEYLGSVFDRFLNPFLHHRLYEISLNSFAKFQSRVLPSLLAYEQIHGTYPKRLVFSLAALLSFYKPVEETGDKAFGKGPKEKYEIRDSKEVIEEFSSFWSRYDENGENSIELIKETVLNNMLKINLVSQADKLAEAIMHNLELIKNKGMEEALRQVEEFNEKGM